MVSKQKPIMTQEAIGRASPSQELVAQAGRHAPRHRVDLRQQFGLRIYYKQRHCLYLHSGVTE
jgi:hypothetical protein